MEGSAWNSPLQTGQLTTTFTSDVFRVYVVFRLLLAVVEAYMPDQGLQAFPPSRIYVPCLKFYSLSLFQVGAISSKVIRSIVSIPYTPTLHLPDIREIVYVRPYIRLNCSIHVSSH
jgi:hypothetical protein